MARRLPETGTTAFLPTLITAPVEQLAEALAASRPAPARSAGPARGCSACTWRARSSRRRGAARTTRPGSPTRPRPRSTRCSTPAAACSGWSRWRPSGRARWRRSTSWPPRACWSASGTATPPRGRSRPAADAGARMVTHLFNAQRPLHHREPGVVGQALTDDRLTSGLIVDLHHVSGPACAIAFRAAPGRIALVTDAAACAGMPPGEYLLGGEPITLPPGDGAPPVRADGTLAGSALRMDRAVANVVSRGRRPARGRGRRDPDPGGPDRPARPRPACPGRGRRPGLAQPGPVGPGDLDRRAARVHRWRCRHAGDVSARRSGLTEGAPAEGTRSARR